MRPLDEGSVTEIRFGDPDRTSAAESNERTNERTDVEAGDVSQSGALSRRERAYQGFDTDEITLGHVLAAGDLWRDHSERHERVRIGKRDPIAPEVRAAIWFRDRGLCDECGHSTRPDIELHLDHIYPWSAGGSDTSDNLRMLCKPHNEERSNFVDGARPKRPVTWWCSNCYTDEHEWTYLGGGFVECPSHSSRIDGTTRCRVGRAYRKAWTAISSDLTWHQREPLTSWPHLAYCAHCDAPGMTSVVL